jgi:hypothetical protein
MVTDGILASQLVAGSPGSAASASADRVERFQEAYGRASAQLDATAEQSSGTAAALLNPLLGLNTDSVQLAQQAGKAASLAELRPSELMTLTMQSHEFLFHCELVANVANRSSDGVQQLFKQQS